MLFDFILLLVCIGSAGVLWYRISHKIPELVAIPDEVIVDRLHEDSARIRVFLLNIRRYLRDGAYWTMLLWYAERVLYRIHILLLKADNAMMALVKRMRARQGRDVLETNGNVQAAAYEASEQNTRPSLPAVSAPAMPSASAFKHSRIQEVRRKRTSKTPA